MILASRSTIELNVGNILVLPDGRFLIAYPEGKPFFDARQDGRFDDPWVPEHLVVQYGHGQPVVWDELQTVMELPMGIGTWEGCTSLVDRDQTIHLFGIRYLKWPEDIENPVRGEWRADLAHVASRDGGATWEPPKHLEYGHDSNPVIMAVIQLENGRLVAPVAFYDFDRTEGKNVCKSCYSDDGGRAWRHDSTDVAVASGGQHSHSGACEPVAVQLGDGRVWMLIRTQFRRLYESFSDDGRVWSQPQPTRFRAPNSPCHVIRLRDGRLILAWNNTQGPPFGGQHGDVHGSRHVLNAAVSHDDGGTWHGYREFARQVVPENDDDQVSYPKLTELPDGKLLVSFAHIHLRGAGGWAACHTDYVVLDPDRLDETSDREDFSNGLVGWSLNGTAGASVATVDGENVLRLQHTGEQPLGAERNFPFAPRGTLEFEIRREAASEGVDLVLDETFWRPNDRRPDAAIEIDLGADALSADEWMPVTVAWDVAEGQAEVGMSESRRRLPVKGSPLGVCYLTFHGRSACTEQGATLVRGLETRVRR